jgi:hypothetical protein
LEDPEKLKELIELPPFEIVTGWASHVG